MKILMLAAYFYDGVHPEFTRNNTGFGLLIPEIAMSVGKEEKVFLDTYIITKGFEMKSNLGKGIVCRHTFWGILRSINLRFLANIFKRYMFNGEKVHDKLHALYYELNKETIKRTIDKVKPDIVHIHDIQLPFIEACAELNVPFIVTLHGLNGFLSSIDERTRKLEREFLQKAYEKKIIVTVISSGIKKRIEKEYLNMKSASNIRIVQNGTNCERDGMIVSNKKKYISVIGTICERKNQREIIEAIHIIKDELKEYQVVICGRDNMNGQLQELVHKYEMDSLIIFKGFLLPSEIDTILDATVLNVLASTDEGFGLSMIEGFTHGVPTVTFSDLDAIEDIFDPNVMILCEERSTNSLAEAIMSAINRKWDGEYIKMHSKKFSLENMAKKYIDVYRSVLDER